MKNLETGDERTKQEAVDWFIRLQSDTAREEDWRLFERWIGADKSRQAAFEALEQFWIDLDIAPVDVLNSPANFAVRSFRRKTSLIRTWGLGGAIAASLAALLAAPYLFHGPSIPPLKIFATHVGERKSLFLNDGTRVDLNSASKIAFQANGDSRRVVLMTGEAAFKVAHDSKRPFTVLAGDRRVTDLGTVFDVSRFGGRLSVTVEQGEVGVAPTQYDNPEPIAVKAGMQLVHQDGAFSSTVRPVDVTMAMAWRDGRLVYRDAALRTVVSDLNRYFQTPIHIEGKQTEELRFSGVLVLDSENAVVRRLEAFLPLAAKRSDKSVQLSMRRQTP